tara:strand:- start:399 stop:1010 length:612 start_codon:yes stop_codon:yes gene_type:complete
MTKVKLYTLWIAISIIIIFIFQTFMNNFTELFVLNNLSWVQPWRFVTSIFLHGSVQHLLGNMFALLFFGLILEKTVGSKKFIGIYLISGILANLIAINFYSSSLGASGAIMGIIGALTILRPGMQVFAFGIIMPMFVAAITWIVVDAIGIFIPSNVGHIAHLSGIVFGGVFALFIRKQHVRKKQHKIKVPEHLMRRWETLYMD